LFFLSVVILYYPRPAVKLAAWALTSQPPTTNRGILLTDPRTHGLKPDSNCLPVDQGLGLYPGPYVQGSVLVARGRPTPIFTVDFREFLTHTLDVVHRSRRQI